MSVVTARLGDRSLKNDVCAEIVRMLHQGEVRPGDRISEAEIASRLGISRSPVREAFVQLAHDGVIVQKPRSGNFIANRTDRELIDLQETRMLIEAFAARNVSERYTNETDRLLNRIIAAMAEVEGSTAWLEGSRLNAEFHQTVVDLSANSSLIRFWKSLDPLTWLLVPWSMPTGTLVQTDLVSRHQLLVEALASGDSDRAAAAFADHILRATVLAGGDPPRVHLALAAAGGTRKHAHSILKGG